MPKPIVVKNDTEIPVEIIAQAIVAISEGIKKLRSSRLKDDALFLLIQRASPDLRNPYRKVGIKEIEAVFEGIESLERKFLKKA